jgi:hypothetical protein
MALIDAVKTLCDRLAPLGWRDLMRDVGGNGLDIVQQTPTALRRVLVRTLPTIKRTLPGFADFSSEGHRAITAGKPAQSLLYHAMASPLVVRDHHGKLLGGFPTPLELETLENFIFSLSADSLPNLIAANGGISKVAFAVFASEYRPAADTVDGRHADLVFSRTGVARVGTARAQYLPESRGYWPEDADNPSQVRVMPAKFSLWLAVKKKGSASRVSPILDNGSGQAAEEASRDFWIPAHKIFSGSECLSGTALTVTFTRRLLNVKIQKVHESLGTSPLPSGFPYVLEDSVIADFSTDSKDGTGCLIPTVHPSLVAPAMKDGKPVTYRVTPGKVKDFAAFEPGEGYPSYVHARTRIGANGSAEDLNEETDIIKAMKAKPYKALHYVDFTGEGWIAVELTGLAGNIPLVLAAYTLIGAPDFFPASGQFELSEWSRSPAIPAAFRGKLWNIDPTPLSEIRFPANLQLPGTPFTAADNTITAVVSMGAPLGQAPVWPVQPDPLRATALPDDAAGVFAPGWDVGQDSNGTTEHLAAYSLGSPFPEDAKLCAALSTFWPAVAPDIFRTFVQVPGNVNGTVVPLTDAEIGQIGGLPWDGVPGPRVVDVGGEKKVEYAAFLNADYVRLALQNRFSIRHTARLTAEDYQSRIIASCRVYNVLAELGDLLEARNQWLMLSFVKVEAGNTALQHAQTEAGHILAGDVYGVKMCRMSNQRERVNAKTERMPLIDLTEVFVSASDVLVLHKLGGSPRFIRTRSE